VPPHQLSNERLQDAILSSGLEAEPQPRRRRAWAAGPLAAFGIALALMQWTHRSFSGEPQIVIGEQALPTPQVQLQRVAAVPRVSRAPSAVPAPPEVSRSESPANLGSETLASRRRLRVAPVATRRDSVADRQEISPAPSEPNEVRAGATLAAARTEPPPITPSEPDAEPSLPALVLLEPASDNDLARAVELDSTANVLVGG